MLCRGAGGGSRRGGAGASWLAPVLLAALLTGPAPAHEGQEPPPQAAPASQRFEFEAPAPGSYRLPPIQPAPDAALRDTTGHRLRLHDVLGGRIVLLSLVYLSCADACPVASAVLRTVRAAAAEDPTLRDALALITVSFDPERDSPADLAAYAAAWRGSLEQPRWQFHVAASPDAAGAMTAAYGQPVQRPPGAGADVAHLLRVYLIDRQRRVRNIYGMGFLDPRLLLADVRTLLLESGAGP